MPPGQDDPIGRGMARERTALAWNRSALALATIGAVIVRIGAQANHTAAALAGGAVLAAVAIVVWMFGRRVFAGRASGKPPSYAEQRRGLLLITAASIVAAAFAAGFAMWS